MSSFESISSMDRHPELEKLAEGREAEVFAISPDLVVRLMRRTDRRRSLEFEFAALKAAKEGACPVPAPREIVQIDGRPGLVMERVDGGDLMGRLLDHPASASEVAGQMARLHASIHQVMAPQSVPTARQWLSTRVEGAGLSDELWQRVARVLSGLPDGDRLCHGDFHPANILQRGEELFIIDWPNTTSGDPMHDVARTLVMLKHAPASDIPAESISAIEELRRSFLSSYLEAYGRHGELDMERLSRWEVVHAAARLSEEIPGERTSLLDFISQGLS